MISETVAEIKIIQFITNSSVNPAPLFINNTNSIETSLAAKLIIAKESILKLKSIVINFASYTPVLV